MTMKHVLFFGLAAISMSAAAMAATDSPSLEVVQSVPLETNLAIPGIRQAKDVWVEMINSAKTSIDLEQFYISDQAGQALAPVLDAIRQAAKRGVRVRVIADKKFYATYPESVNDLGQQPNSESRLIDFSNLGGIQHAKFFVIDGKQAFSGSQNFDWRALDHIHEVGVRVWDAQVVGDIERIFERDWGVSVPVSAKSPAAAPLTFLTDTLFGDAASAPSRDLYVAASPARATPAGIADTATEIVQLLASAQSTARIQTMEYGTKAASTDKKPWRVLDDAIRAAAARGVKVELMIDAGHFATAKADLEGLAAVKNVRVRSVTIPQFSGGAIDFARLIHSKYLVVDGRASWVGSENWTEGYFINTRNVGVVVHSQTIADQLTQIYDKLWQQSYSADVAPAAAAGN